MTVFILHSEADQAAVGALARAIERRGHFVELETGDRIGRPLQEADALILLWSAAMAADRDRLAGERRAFDAWAEGRLAPVALDETPLPVGLRDLPVVRGAAIATMLESVHEALAEALKPRPAPAPESRKAEKPPARSAAQTAEARPSPREVPAHRRGLRGLFILIGLFVVIALGVYVFRRLQYRSFEDGIGQAGAFLAPGLGIVLALAAIWVAFSLLGRPKKKAVPRKRAARSGQAKPGGPALFVSYAHDDAIAVGSVVAAVERAGRPVWVDKTEVKSGQGWAGEIVRAIKAAPGVLVMCSARAFQSDHVKREVYLADRYGKPLLPVFLEAASPPADFEYFFAGVQPLDLHRTPEADRPEAIKRALAGV